MKKFIKNIIVFTLFLLILNYIGYRITFKNYLSLYEEVDLGYKSYLLGDSQGKAVGDFGEERDIYNFCDDSDSYEDMYRKLSYLLRNSDVDSVFVTVNNHTLSEYREVKNNDDRSLVFKDFESFFDKLKYYVINRYLVLTNSKYRDIIKLSLFHHKMEASQKKWGQREKELRETLANRRVENQFVGKKKSLVMQEFLKKLIEKCKSHQVKLIGVKFPLSKEMNKRINNMTFGADFILKQKGCELLDLSRALEGNSSLFRDTDHVNKKGARRFWEVFINSLNR